MTSLLPFTEASLDSSTSGKTFPVKCYSIYQIIGPCFQANGLCYEVESFGRMEKLLCVGGSDAGG